MGKNKACKHDGPEGCATVPSYGFPGTDGKRGTAVRCSHHKLPGMVDVVSKTCNWPEGCKSQASYGHLTTDGKRDSASRSRCRQHREPGMVDVINKTCVEGDCSTRPCYGFPSDESGKRGNPERCSLHKLPGMINVVGKPLFVPKKMVCNVEGRSLCSLFVAVRPACLTHRSGCMNFPLFGIAGVGGKKGVPVRCSMHRTEGMVNVQHKTCQYDGPGGCTTLSRSPPGLSPSPSLSPPPHTCFSYGLAGPTGKRGMAIRCKAHKVLLCLPPSTPSHSPHPPPPPPSSCLIW